MEQDSTKYIFRLSFVFSLTGFLLGLFAFIFMVAAFAMGLISGFIFHYESTTFTLTRQIFSFMALAFLWPSFIINAIAVFKKHYKRLAITGVILTFIVFLMFCFLILVPLGNTTKQQVNIEIPGNSSDWAGKYTYSEYAPPDENWIYNLEVYQERGSLKARLNIDGFQTMRAINTSTVEKDGQLVLISDSGDTLFSLIEENGKYKITWEKLQPYLSKDQNNNYFEKIK